MIASFVMSVIESTYEINKVLQHFYRLFPGFCLGNGLLNLTIRSSVKALGSGIIEIRSPYSWSVVGSDLTYLILEGLIYFALTILIDSLLNNPNMREAASRLQKKRFVGFPRPKPRTPSSGNGNLVRASSSILGAEEVDEDVTNEEARIDSGNAESDMLVLSHLKKAYSNGKEAVQDLSFGVPTGECFGFLGTNGAGKTTTLKILTGDLLPTLGKCKCFLVARIP